MAYSTAGLRPYGDGAIRSWVLDTVDTVATATTGSYVTDATSSSTAGTPGRGLSIGDPVLIRVVGAIPVNGQPPATCTDQAWAFVGTLSTVTGAGALVAT
jgi:hypothetical protein